MEVIKFKDKVSSLMPVMYCHVLYTGRKNFCKLYYRYYFFKLRKFGK